MFPNWVNKYIGTPFEDCNCWQLICRVYRDQLGIELPDLEARYEDPQDRAAIKKLYHSELARIWRRTDMPELFTAVVFRIRGQLWHVGLVLTDKFMLHSFENVDCVIESYGASAWRHRIEGFYNYAG